MKQAFVFPGQGSQAVGMGREFADSFKIAKETFQEVDEVLNQNLSKLIFEGPLDELTLTQNTQPALMAVSVAIMRVLEKEAKITMGDCSYIAGHSLGEYSALAASGAISLKDTSKLLRIRGDAMQSAVPVGVGAMVAVMADIETCRQLAGNAAQGEVCDVANYNTKEQIVLSGHDKAIDRLIALATEQQKRAIKLNVSAPFHSQLMLPAQKIMLDALEGVNISAPSVPLIANVTAEETRDPELIRSLLVKQVTGMVRWYESILLLKEKGVTKIVEIGAGRVLSGLTKRIDKEIETISIQAPSDIDSFVKSL